MAARLPRAPLPQPPRARPSLAPASAPRLLQPATDLDPAAEIGRHLVQFYRQDGFLLDEVETFLRQGLETGDSGLVIATATHSAALRARFEANPARQPPTFLDADATLARFMQGDEVGPDEFQDVVGGTLQQLSASASTGRVRAYGEMVGVLCTAGRHDAAVRLEQAWNVLGQQHDFVLLCGYPLDAFRDPAHANAFLRLCSEHDHVAPAEDYPRLGDTEEQNRYVAALQQRLEARVQEAAVAQQGREEHEQAVLERARRLAESNRSLEEFTAAVSHDLRSPLRTINGFSGLLVRRHAARLEPEARELLDGLRKAAGRMTELVDDLLDLARSSDAAVERGDVDLTALAEQVVATLRARDPRRHVTVEVAPGLHTSGDERLLRIVLENLLGNAWKFTAKQPHARIGLDATPSPDGPAFTVRDNGAGFDPARSAELFQAFRRLHSDEDYEGTGIGLVTVRRIIERHGGRVWATGAIGEGAAFSFSLPVPAAPPA